jgi:hypothetical protein
MGFCGDGFDQGGICISDCCDLSDDGHFLLNGSGCLSKPLPDRADINGVRPALWLKD